MSFLKLLGVTDRIGGDGLTDDTTGVLLNGELLKDLMSMRGLGGKLRPEAFEVALPGLRGWTRVARGASSSEELSEESEVSLSLTGLLEAAQRYNKNRVPNIGNGRTYVLDRGRGIWHRSSGRRPTLDGGRTSRSMN